MFQKAKLPGFVLPLLVIALVLSVLSGGCKGSKKSEEDQKDNTPEVLLKLFQDVTEEAGVAHTHRNGQEAEHFAILESLGGGVALIDYDGDGLLDIYATGGGYYDGEKKDQIKGHRNRIYKNLGNFKFKEITDEVGLSAPLFYTHGAAVGDYNNDGWPDLLVTGWGRVVLYENVPNDKGGRKFVDVTAKAGLNDDLWSTSAGFADFDGDGFADLYICHYVDWSLKNNPECGGYSVKIKRDVCPPKRFMALPHILYRNNGNGTFSDVSKTAGLRPGDTVDLKNGGKGLGVILVDVNNDGKPDIYVANDTVDNFLYLNRSTPGKIKFDDIGLRSGTARDDRGIPDGSMGVAAADFNRCGRASLWVTNYENEMHGLYLNTGIHLETSEPSFSFYTASAGIAAIGQSYVSFGTAFLDLENDGWEDIVIANGHVIRFPVNGSVPQKPVLLRNRGVESKYRLTKDLQDRLRREKVPAEVTEKLTPLLETEYKKKAEFQTALKVRLEEQQYAEHQEAILAVARHDKIRFEEYSKHGGSYFHSKHTGRGLAAGDLDNDGRVDLIFANSNEPINVLRNTCDSGNHWLGIEVKGAKHRDIVGARLELTVGDETIARFVQGGGSYLSAPDHRHVFGLGKTDKVGNLVVHWPGGQSQKFEGLTTNRYWSITEGEEKAK